VDGGEEAHGADDEHDEVDGEPDVEGLHSHAQDEVGEDEGGGDQHHPCHYPEVAHG
jgi:hypothetical protein